MRLIRYSPFLEPFEDWDKEIEKSFSQFAAGFTPAVDLYQDKDNVVVETPITGVDPEKINITIENDVLAISGQSEKKTEVDEKNYYKREVRYGSFHRAVALPVPVKEDQVKAEYADGVLKITMPKSEKAKPKTVKVQVKKKK